MTYEDVEPLRASYRPAKIKGLFVGESPSFVDSFKQAGFYLDDLVLEPVNWLSRTERQATHATSIASLANRLRDIESPLVVAFMKGIAAPVKTAIAASGVSCQFEVVPFPDNGRQAEFRSAITAILPMLLNR